MADCCPVKHVQTSTEAVGLLAGIKTSGSVSVHRRLLPFVAQFGALLLRHTARPTENHHPTPPLTPHPYTCNS